jgi:hypothetical protein
MSSPQTEKHETIYLDKLREIKLLNNLVLCRKITNNITSTTKSGVLKVAESFNRDQYLPQNVDRCFEVVAVPDHLVDKFGGSMSDIDIVPGDVVWVVYLASLNAKRIITENEEYRFIPYTELILAKRRLRETNFDWKDVKTYRHKYVMEDEKIFEVIALNGFVVFSDVREDVKTELELPDHLKKRLVKNVGHVNFVGKPIKYYIGKQKDYSEKGLSVRGGDYIVIFKGQEYIGNLEDPYHLHFNGDKKYRYIRRKYIGAILKSK